MTESLKEILRLHALWTKGSPKGKKAEIRDVNLRDVNLRDVNLRDVNLQNTNLRWADLRGADLRGADLQEADLQYVCLQWADLRLANLQCANLQGADLQDTELQWAKLHRANLKGVKTSYTNNWARTFFLHGAGKEACQWVEEQNLESLRELVGRCPEHGWIEWLEENGFWLGE